MQRDDDLAGECVVIDTVMRDDRVSVTTQYFILKIQTKTLFKSQSSGPLAVSAPTRPVSAI